MLDAAIDRYLENVALKSSKTSNGYTLQQFYRALGNKPLTEVAKQDLYDFVAYLRREELSDRTVHNRVGEVVTFLRHFRIKDVTLRVKFTERKVRAYRPDEIKGMFAVADLEETILLHFFLCTAQSENGNNQSPTHTISSRWTCSNTMAAHSAMKEARRSDS